MRLVCGEDRHEEPRPARRFEPGGHRRDASNRSPTGTTKRAHDPRLRFCGGRVRWRPNDPRTPSGRAIFTARVPDIGYVASPSWARKRAVIDPRITAAANKTASVHPEGDKSDGHAHTKGGGADVTEGLSTGGPSRMKRPLLRMATSTTANRTRQTALTAAIRFRGADEPIAQRQRTPLPWSGQGLLIQGRQGPGLRAAARQVWIRTRRGSGRPRPRRT